MQPEFDTMVEAIERLRALGYTYDFNLRPDCLECSSKEKSLSPDEFEIDKIYRFDGMTNPDDESILYAISSKDHNMKGILVNGYGPDSDPFSQEMIEKLAQRF